MSDTYAIVKSWHSGNSGPLEYEEIGSLEKAKKRLSEMRAAVPHGFRVSEIEYSHYGGFQVTPPNPPYLLYYIVKKVENL